MVPSRRLGECGLGSGAESVAPGWLGSSPSRAPTSPHPRPRVEVILPAAPSRGRFGRGRRGIAVPGKQVFTRASPGVSWHPRSR